MLGSLPRLTPSQARPGMWRAAGWQDCGVRQNTDTMRSSRSLASVKSVQASHTTVTLRRPGLVSFQHILPEMLICVGRQICDRVTEWRYCEEAPVPVYATISNKRARNNFTKDQIIDLYCTQNYDQ